LDVDVSKGEPGREAGRRRGAFHGADGRHDGLRHPRPVGEKAQTAAELQARTALRVFEESLASNSRYVSYAQATAGHYTATIWDGTAFEYAAGRSTGSAMSRARG
jgi:hypothetical protein